MISRDIGRLILVIVFALAFLVTVAGALGAALWGSDTSGARVGGVVTALLPTETLLLGAAVVWYFAGQ